MLNPQFYLSAEEKARIEKAKYKIKKYFFRFFEKQGIK